MRERDFEELRGQVGPGDDQHGGGRVAGPPAGQGDSACQRQQDKQGEWIAEVGSPVCDRARPRAPFGEAGKQGHVEMLRRARPVGQGGDKEEAGGTGKEADQRSSNVARQARNGSGVCARGEAGGRLTEAQAGVTGLRRVAKERSLPVVIAKRLIRSSRRSAGSTTASTTSSEAR